MNIIFMHHFHHFIPVDDLGEYQDQVEREIIFRFYDAVNSSSSLVLSKFRGSLDSVLSTLDDLLEDSVQDCATEVVPAPMAGPAAGSQDSSSTE